MKYVRCGGKAPKEVVGKRHDGRIYRGNCYGEESWYYDSQRVSSLRGTYAKTDGWRGFDGLDGGMMMGQPRVDDLPRQETNHLITSGQKTSREGMRCKRRRRREEVARWDRTDGH